MRPRRIFGTLLALGIVVTVLGACGTATVVDSAASAAASMAASPAVTPTISATPSGSTRPKCPNPDGYLCLGLLEAGTYTTAAFTPQLTYTVPAGWQNLEDLPGNFLLLPPGYDLDGVDAAFSEYIGIYASVRAENRLCTTEAEAESDEPGVAYTPQAIAAEFASRPGLTTTEPQPVTIGGLSGLVMDIRMADGWTGTCFFMPAGEPIVQLTGGLDPTHIDHSVDPAVTMRLYLLQGRAGRWASR